MKNQLFLILLALPALLWSAENTETQAWYVETISGKITPGLALWGEIHYRYSYDFDGLAVHHALLGANVKVNNWLTLTPFMRTVHAAKGAGPVANQWSVEYRPTLDTKISWKLPSLQSRYRLRIEYRHYPDKDEAVCLRQQIELTFRQKWTRLELQPCLSDEIFYQKNRDGFFRNWVNVGMNIKIYKAIKCMPFVMLESGLGEQYAGCRKLIVGNKLKLAF